MKPVFLDTVGLLATWNESDQWHGLAFPVYQQILRDRRLVVTQWQALHHQAGGDSLAGDAR